MLQVFSLPKARGTAGHLLGSEYSLPLSLILRKLHTCMDMELLRNSYQAWHWDQDYFDLDGLGITLTILEL